MRNATLALRDMANYYAINPPPPPAPPPEPTISELMKEAIVEGYIVAVDWICDELWPTLKDLVGKNG